MVLVGLAEYYKISLTENQLAMYANDLETLELEELSHAVKKYRVNPDHKFFPLPAQLIAEVNPHMNPIDDARDVSNLIITAISKHGYTNPEMAENYIGTLGWEIVRRFGGWKHICENTMNNDLGMLRAQLRDFSMTIQKKSIRGELNERPRLSHDVEDFEKQARLEYDADDQT